jgi:hypothetical protein
MSTQAPGPGDVFARGMTSAMRLVWREAETLDEFRDRVTDARPSFAVALIVAPVWFGATFALPALVTDLGRLGASSIDPAVLAGCVSLAMLASFVLYPMIVRPFLTGTDGRQRLAGYVAATNIATIPVTLAVSGPVLLFGVGLIEAPVAAATALASAILTVELRYFLATRILGVDPGLAGVLVGLDIGLQSVLVQIAIAATIVLR